MEKINWTPEQEAEINRVQRTTGVTRKSAIRKMRAAAKVQAKVKAQAVKTTPKPQPQQKSAGVNRSEGIRLFKVAGRPTKEQFILVYGERGAKDDMGAAGGSGCTSRAVPGRAGSEGAGVSGIKFSPGSVVTTPGALEALRASGDDPLAYLVRHIAGDCPVLSIAYMLVLGNYAPNCAP